MARFIAVITFGDRDTRLQARAQHRAYLAELVAQGKLHESGPFADEQGALIVYEAIDLDEARSLVEADPYSAAGVIARVDIHEWKRTIPAE